MNEDEREDLLRGLLLALSLTLMMLVICVGIWLRRFH